MRTIHQFQHLIHPLTDEEMVGGTADITQSVTSRFDFFLLVVLSCNIATFGLIINSSAMIIGVMMGETLKPDHGDCSHLALTLPLVKLMP
jgi:hypothetical protein